MTNLYLGGNIKKMKFIGTCKDDAAWQTLFADATEMAQCVENSKSLKWNEFCALFNDIRTIIVPIDNNPFIFAYKHIFYGYNESEKIAWIYDSEKDIHYFYSI